MANLQNSHRLELAMPWYRWPIEIDGLPGFTELKNGDFLVSYVK